MPLAISERFSRGIGLRSYLCDSSFAEFLYHCVRTTIESDLPYEVEYLKAYDAFTTAIASMVNMPARTVELLHRFLRQNNGRLSPRARTGEFAGLTDTEVADIKQHYAGLDLRVPSLIGEGAVVGGSQARALSLTTCIVF